ncbi:hypothetical protein DICPUDRAFT_94784 [Dictyostelium purpureum]|uniref:Uncharacterized protein n=1 Tax=Dictyostelium purpureum TaxID=5786 RepID=F0ZNF8_DICPU|nr:uncharacterized protein DICPUDRAFT_94784 [Dictyostelium purpureum]EGC34507.1 hypothetical protein DICPUDRAFT_94784 [Dictyostelium purpureum]|eukprot:XP_003288943.1 hypothetical protein DICPUDRAFT_94784 [Dictyostelium purpureum]
MNFFFNCCTCNNKFNFHESYCESCLQRIKNDQSKVFDLIQSVFDKKRANVEYRTRIINDIQDPSNRLKETINIKSTYLESRKQQLEVLKNKIQNLKVIVNKDNGYIDVKKKYLSTRRSSLKKNKQSFENANNDDNNNNNNSNTNNSVFISLSEEIQKKKEQSAIENNQLQIIKRTKVDQLANVVKLQISLNPNNPDHYLLFNMVLNDNQLLKFPKDIIFTTLGYISKIVFLISSILGITLPYHLNYKGSKSTIHHNLKSKDYPLFYHKTKSREFQKALYLLGENISFLRFYHGLSSPKESNLLFLKNVCELVKSPNLGKDQQNLEIRSMDIEYDDTKEDEWEVVTPIEEDDSFEKFIYDHSQQ